MEAQYRSKAAAYQVKEKAPAFSKDMIRDKKIQFETRNLTKQQLAKTLHTPARPTAGKNAPRTGQSPAAGTARKGIEAAKAAATTAASQSIRLSGGDELAESKLDDIGLQAGEHLKQGVVSTKNTAQSVLKMARAIPSAGKQTTQAAHAAAKATEKTAKAAQTTAKATAQTAKAVKRTVQNTVRAVNAAGKTAAAAASNPYVWLVVLIVLLVILVILMVVMVVSIANSTPKNILGEKLYTELSEYTLKKDLDLLSVFENYENRPEFEGIDKENVTKKQNVTPSTSFKHLSAYLVAKLGGEMDFETGRAEIDRLHDVIYTITATTGTTTAIEEQQAVDEDGNPVMEEVETECQTLTVTLDGIPMYQYLTENIGNLLTPEQLAHYNYLLTLSGPGGLTGIVGAPFEDHRYMSRISQEFGVIGAGDGQPHRGMDFFYPEGTPLLSVMDGRVTEVSHHYSWGLNVVIESGPYRLRYAHMSAANVSTGDTVAAGEIFGAVGNTGTSFGAHLHLEVEENGRLINPREILAAK